MATMNADYQKDFLAKTRYGYLTTLTKDGAPKTVPVWFDWDDYKVRIFSVAGTAKLKRIGKDPRVTVLVASEMNASALTTSPVAALTSGGPPRKMVPLPLTMTLSSAMAGT